MPTPIHMKVLTSHMQFHNLLFIENSHTRQIIHLMWSTLTLTFNLFSLWKETFIEYRILGWHYFHSVYLRKYFTVLVFCFCYFQIIIQCSNDVSHGPLLFRCFFNIVYFCLILYIFVNMCRVFTNFYLYWLKFVGFLTLNLM